MKERILIIEDDEGISKVLRRALVYEGYQVDSAMDGESGLNLNRDNHPDLVVLDWMLPGMDGLEVCRRLREIGSTPILMLTARGETSQKIKGFQLGSDDYLVAWSRFQQEIGHRVIWTPRAELSATYLVAMISPGAAPLSTHCSSAV